MLASSLLKTNLLGHIYGGVTCASCADPWKFGDDHAKGSHHFGTGHNHLSLVARIAPLSFQSPWWWKCWTHRYWFWLSWRLLRFGFTMQLYWLCPPCDHRASGRHDEVAFISSQDTVATRTRSQTLAANATDSKNKVSCCFLCHYYAHTWPSLPAALTAESMPEACRAILHPAGSLPSEISPWQPSIA